MPANRTQGKIDGEEPTLFQIVKMSKRHAQRTIRQVQDPLGNILDSPKYIVSTFVMQLQYKYKRIVVGERYVSAMKDVIRPLPPPNNISRIIRMTNIPKKSALYYGQEAETKPCTATESAYNSTQDTEKPYERAYRRY